MFLVYFHFHLPTHLWSCTRHMIRGHAPYRVVEQRSSMSYVMVHHGQGYEGPPRPATPPQPWETRTQHTRAQVASGPGQPGYRRYRHRGAVFADSPAGTVHLSPLEVSHHLHTAYHKERLVCSNASSPGARILGRLWWSATLPSNGLF